jgi:hypothetical protein
MVAETCRNVDIVESYILSRICKATQQEIVGVLGFERIFTGQSLYTRTYSHL